MSDKNASLHGSQRSLRTVEVNPAWVVVALVLVVFGLGYLFWLRPAQQEDAAARAFNTPDAAEKRAPGHRPINATLEKLRQDVANRQNQK